MSRFIQDYDKFMTYFIKELFNSGILKLELYKHEQPIANYSMFSIDNISKIELNLSNAFKVETSMSKYMGSSTGSEYSKKVKFYQKKRNKYL